MAKISISQHDTITLQTYVSREVINLAYGFEIRPTYEQAQKMFHTLKFCRKLYNRSLAERITAYKTKAKNVQILFNGNIMVDKLSPFSFTNIRKKREG